MDPLASLRAEVDRLREENARLTSTLAMTVGRLGGKVEGHETARHNFLQRIDALRLMEEEVHHAHAAMARDADVISYLRAHVAALVQGINDVALGLGFQSSVAAQDAYVKLRALLDAPDVAALVARAEKEQAVIAAARAFLHEADVNFDLDDPTSPMHAVTEQLEEALAALDTKEPTEG
jgi:hypothetical protein